jgi:ribosomal protein S2
MSKLTNDDIDRMISKLQSQTTTLSRDLDHCLTKKERLDVLRRHNYLEKCIKTLFLLKNYD